MKTNPLRLAVAIAVLAHSFITPKSDGAVPTHLVINVEGLERHAMIFAPDNLSGGKVPLVLAFHGHGGNPPGFAQVAPLQNAWLEALVVYPRGIQTLLTAEKSLGLREAIFFAPGAMSWANERLQAREKEAVREAKVPLFLLQARNDFSTGPSEILGPLIESKGGINRAKFFPAFGSTHTEGHGGFACWEEGIAIWGNDLLDFLQATGMTPLRSHA